jgi:hypothetical protein
MLENPRRVIKSTEVKIAPTDPFKSVFSIFFSIKMTHLNPSKKEKSKSPFSPLGAMHRAVLAEQVLSAVSSSRAG